MATREGSVYLYLFIVAMVLFGLMTALFFFSNAEEQRLAQELESVKIQRTDVETDREQLLRQLTDLQVLVAGPAYRAGDEIWPGNEHFYSNELKGKAEKAINGALEDLGQEARNYESLVSVFGDLQGLLMNLRQARDEAFEARRTSSESLAEKTTSMEESLNELREQYADAQRRITELEASNEDLDNRFKAEKSEWVRELEMAKSDASDEKIRLQRLITFKDNNISSLKRRIDDLLQETVKEKSFDDVDPDGNLLTVLSNVEKGWIDLGRVNHLRKGLIFRVFQYVKGGKKMYKGTVEVLKVEETMSEVRVIDEYDPLNPITGGDYISSPFYDPETQPIFVFSGAELASKGMTRQGLEAKMARFGAVVRDKVDLSTDFLVATEGYEQSPEYRAAQELGVTIIRERDLLEFLGQ